MQRGSSARAVLGPLVRRRCVLADSYRLNYKKKTCVAKKFKKKEFEQPLRPESGVDLSFTRFLFLAA
jgi:hypothetical protein